MRNCKFINRNRNKTANLTSKHAEFTIPDVEFRNPTGLTNPNYANKTGR